MDLEDLAATVVDAAYHLHKDIGPGLLESVYDHLLTRSLRHRGLQVERQVEVPFERDGARFDKGLRLDLLVERRLIVEVKSVERLLPVHVKQTVTYLRMLDLRMGLLLNFGGATFKGNVKRLVNGYQDGRSSPRASRGGVSRQGR